MQNDASLTPGTLPLPTTQRWDAPNWDGQAASFPTACWEQNENDAIQ